MLELGRRHGLVAAAAQTFHDDLNIDRSQTAGGNIHAVPHLHSHKAGLHILDGQQVVGRLGDGHPGLGSIIWYLSCNYLLFPGHKTTSKQLLCFVLDIVVCYLLSYYLIGPYVSRLLLRSHSVTRFFSFGGTENIRGNCEMSVGSLSYALLNYFGQRYFVFSDRFAARKDRNTEA